MSDGEIKKKVDEEWKSKVQNEKTQAQDIAQEREDNAPTGELTFSSFVEGLAARALIHMGLLPNPVTKKQEIDILQAKQTIDILQLLQDKTVGNLSQQEAEQLEGILHELRLGFVRVSK